jgi:hypothetical protein
MSHDVVWEPIPNSSQEQALIIPCDLILHCGSRGCGKTEAQLMRFRRLVGAGYGAFWKGVIFDTEYKGLDDIIAKGKRLFNLFDDGCKWLGSKDTYKWVWPTGEELLLRILDSEEDYLKVHGHEYPFVGLNELTKWPTPNLFDMLFSINRSSFVSEKYKKYVDGELLEQGFLEFYDKPNSKTVDYYLPRMPLEMFATTNPNGPGHNWVKSQFINPAPYGEVVRIDTEAFNPRTKQKEIVTRSQVAIFGSCLENPFLDVSYIAGLMNDPDKNRRKAWFVGSWDGISGGAFDDLWNKNVHIIPRFKVPTTWRVDRSYDNGSSHPFSVCWFAEANGEEVEIEWGGAVHKWAPAPGTIIQIFEWYGAEKIGRNKGLKMAARDIAKGIVQIDNELLQGEWISTRVQPGPADNQISNVNQDGESDSVKLLMEKHGCYWTESDKSPGSRTVGMQLFRDRLHAALIKEGPAFYCTQNCTATIETVSVLPRDKKKPDDVDTQAEDHAYDAIKYRILKTKIDYAKTIKFDWM